MWVFLYDLHRLLYSTFFLPGLGCAAEGESSGGVQLLGLISKVEVRSFLPCGGSLGLLIAESFVSSSATLLHIYFVSRWRAGFNSGCPWFVAVAIQLILFLLFYF